MSKVKADILNRVAFDALIHAERTTRAVSMACREMAEAVQPAERGAWLTVARETTDLSVFVSYHLSDTWRRSTDAVAIIEDLGSWPRRALDAAGMVRGIALVHETAHGPSRASEKVTAAGEAASGALSELIDAHYRSSVMRAGIEAVERAETEAMILRAARRVIRRRARGTEFDVGVAEVPSYTVDYGTGVHRIRVTPRWRSLVQRLGTATPRDFVLMLDAEPILTGDDAGCWWVTCAQALADHGIEVARLRWYRPDIADAAASAVAA